MTRAVWKITEEEAGEIAFFTTTLAIYYVCDDHKPTSADFDI